MSTDPQVHAGVALAPEDENERSHVGSIAYQRFRTEAPPRAKYVQLRLYLRMPVQTHGQKTVNVPILTRNRKPLLFLNSGSRAVAA